MFDWGRFAVSTSVWFLALLWSAVITALFICTFADWDWMGWNFIAGILTLITFSAGLAAITEL